MCELFYCSSPGWDSTPLPLSYLCEERLVDLHALVRALRQDVSPTMPAVADGGVGIGDAAQEHRPLVVELLFCFSYTLVHGDHWVIKVCWRQGSSQYTLFQEWFHGQMG